jgi:uncharacterized membrane protein
VENSIKRRDVPAIIHDWTSLPAQTEGDALKVQSRWKSKVVWISIAAILLIILGNHWLYGFLGISQGIWRYVADGVLAILAAFGIFNNPTDAEHF